MSNQTILVIEDDPDGRCSVRDALEDAGCQVVLAANGREGLDAFRKGELDAVLSDIRLPAADGVSLAAQFRELNPDVPVLLMTAYGTVESAVQALKAGVYDYLLKPLDLDDVQRKVEHAIEARRLRQEVSTLKETLRTRFSASTMIVGSDGMRNVLRQIEALAKTDATVLIHGESGTGKELVARALHADGRRALGPFVAVNCGAFAESLLESELFGHEKGAFTGAVKRHPGAFERADGGTLFLDEIGIAPKSVQMRLLRALEQREVIRVGGTEPTRVNVRVVSATNRNLDDLVETGQFLADLLYRLRVVIIRVPPLRERLDDIQPLAEHFIAQACHEHGRLIENVEPGYFDALRAHAWPGNVRELRNAVEASVILTTASVLRSGDVQLGAQTSRIVDSSELDLSGHTLADLEKRALIQALERNKGSRSLAAAALGLSTRTIQRKIKEYQLPF